MHRPSLLVAASAFLTAIVAVQATAADRDTDFAPASRTTAGDASLLARGEPGALRVVTWNIGANSVVGDAGANGRPAAFARVMRALDPDVVCLQELTVGPERAAAMFDRIRPLDGGARWHAVSVLGNVIVSRYPLTNRKAQVFRERFSQRGHVIARVELPDSAASPTVACMHLQAKEGEANMRFRQRHAAAVVGDLADVNGPVIALGDLNAVDDSKPYVQTLVAGRPDGIMPPVVAGSGTTFPLDVAQPSHNGSGTDRYTWRNDRSGFAPGVLDYVLFSASRYEANHTFVLNTATLDDAALAESGLRRDDALRHAAAQDYDHLPVVVDLMGEKQS